MLDMVNTPSFEVNKIDLNKYPKCKNRIELHRDKNSIPNDTYQILDSWFFSLGLQVNVLHTLENGKRSHYSTLTYFADNIFNKDISEAEYLLFCKKCKFTQENYRRSFEALLNRLEGLPNI